MDSDNDNYLEIQDFNRKLREIRANEFVMILSVSGAYI